MFMRGNELLRDGTTEVGGNRVYGGVILSKNPKNNLKWLKVIQYIFFFAVLPLNPFDFLFLCSSAADAILNGPLEQALPELASWQRISHL